MSLQIKPAIEEKSKLVKLLGLIKGDYFEEAKKYADKLLEQGINETSINYSCYDYFRRLVYHEKEKAEELEEVFKDYHWRAWLI